MTDKIPISFLLIITAYIYHPPHNEHGVTLIIYISSFYADKVVIMSILERRKLRFEQAQ